MKNQGIPVILAAIAIQLTLGVAYIWSVFQTGIAETIFNGDNAGAALSFSILIATLSVGSIIGGMLAVKYSTRSVVFVGGIILSAGFFLASFVTAQMPQMLWVTYGLMGGIGMGFTYSTTIACAQRWYPHKKGLVTGIIVASLGFGGVIFTPVAQGLLTFFGGQGVGELKTFRALSVVFLVVCSLGSLFLKNPTDSKTFAATQGAGLSGLTPMQMLKTPQFYLASATLMFACMGGLMMIGFAKPIAVARGLEATAVIGVLAVTMFNSVGRLTWGAISDKLGPINTVIVLLSGTAVLSLLVNVVGGYWIFVLMACIGFFFGGYLGTYPSLTANLFGPKYLATNYGILLLGFSIGAILSSIIAGHYRNIAQTAGDINLMFPAFVIASLCAVGGIVMMVILKVKNRQPA
ncbi:MAG: MFS transporter [Elusimicrobia bacterium]|nr:MFS transporter [Elusimicrobiota bacterium]